jgi:hypothetical protein
MFVARATPPTMMVQQQQQQPVQVQQQAQPIRFQPMQVVARAPTQMAAYTTTSTTAVAAPVPVTAKAMNVLAEPLKVGATTLTGMVLFGRPGALLAPFAYQTANYLATPAPARPPLAQMLVEAGIQSAAAGVGNAVMPNNDIGPAIGATAATLVTEYVFPNKPAVAVAVVPANTRARRATRLNQDDHYYTDDAHSSMNYHRSEQRARDKRHDGRESHRYSPCVYDTSHSHYYGEPAPPHYYCDNPTYCKKSRRKPRSSRCHSSCTLSEPALSSHKSKSCGVPCDNYYNTRHHLCKQQQYSSCKPKKQHKHSKRRGYY